MAVAVEEGDVKPEPLVVHAAAGDCLEVDLTNRLGGGTRASFDVGQLLRGKGSSGINVGFNPEQTVAGRPDPHVPLLRGLDEDRQRPDRRLRR